MNDYMTADTFIIMLVIISVIMAGIYFYRSMKKIQNKRLEKEEKEYAYNECPDYWNIVKREKDSQGRDYTVCKNTHKLGLCALDPERNTFTFDDEIFVNPNISDLSKCKWAKQCGVSWTGYDKLCS
jgi:hypothetical protein